MRQSEIEKAKADPNYIIEPDIRIINTRKDFDVMGDRADRSFNLNAGFIALGNYEDYDNYAPDTQYKVVCTDKDKELINTGTLLTQPFISYDHVYEVRRDKWRAFGDGISKDEDFDTYILFSIQRNEEKSVNGKFVRVYDYIKKDEILNFKLYLKRGNNSREYDINSK